MTAQQLLRAFSLPVPQALVNFLWSEWENLHEDLKASLELFQGTLCRLALLLSGTAVERLDLGLGIWEGPEDRRALHGLPLRTLPG